MNFIYHKWYSTKQGKVNLLFYNDVRGKRKKIKKSSTTSITLLKTRIYIFFNDIF